MPSARYLQFDTIDARSAEVSSRCSACGQEFRAEIKLGERIVDVIQRIREEYNKHECGAAA
ncbi:MAG TPA: hypothetical protein VJP02_15745 [Candidatus Sulfotelmatobacter sp.]|nr:hypothetical protein [Candidatus Sulfotelmatobacter sp.]